MDLTEKIVLFRQSKSCVVIRSVRCVAACPFREGVRILGISKCQRNRTMNRSTVHPDYILCFLFWYEGQLREEAVNRRPGGVE